MIETIAKTERSNLAKTVADWTFLAALVLWVSIRTLMQSFFAVDGIVTKEVFACVKYLCICLCFVHEAILLVRAIRIETRNRAANRSNGFSSTLRKVASNEYVLNLLISLIVLLALYAIVVRNVGGSGLFPQYALLLIFCARNVRFSLIAKVAMVNLAILLVGIIGSSLIGLIPNVYLSTGHAGYCLGFKYPLFPASLLFSFTCLALFLNRKRNYLAVYAVLLFLNFLMYLFVDAQLSFILSAGAILLCFFCSRSSLNTLFRKISPLLTWSFVVLAGTSLIIASSQDLTEMLKPINNMLGDRLNLSYEGLQRYDLLPFGQKLNMHGNGSISFNPDALKTPYFYIDNLYVQVALRFGVVFLVVYLAAYTMAAKRALKREEIVLVIIFTILAIHQTIDDQTLRLQSNLFMLLLWPSGITLISLIKKKLHKEKDPTLDTQE